MLPIYPTEFQIAPNFYEPSWVLHEFEFECESLAHETFTFELNRIPSKPSIVYYRQTQTHSQPSKHSRVCEALKQHWLYMTYMKLTSICCLCFIPDFIPVSRHVRTGSWVSTCYRIRQLFFWRDAFLTSVAFCSKWDLRVLSGIRTTLSLIIISDSTHFIDHDVIWMISWVNFCAVCSSRICGGIRTRAAGLMV